MNSNTLVKMARDHRRRGSLVCVRCGALGHYLCNRRAGSRGARKAGGAVELRTVHKPQRPQARRARRTTRTDLDSGLRATAFHEAGHVVATLLAGGEVDVAAVASGRDGQNWGVCNTTLGAHPGVTVAGVVAVELAGLARGHSNPGPRDRAASAMSVLILGGSRRAQFMADTRKRTRAALRKNWRAVTAVAEALLKAPPSGIDGRTLRRIAEENGLSPRSSR